MTFADSHLAYDELNAEKQMSSRHGTQAGDPKKGAKAMYELAIMDNPPLRVVIGSDAYKDVVSLLPSSSFVICSCPKRLRSAVCPNFLCLGFDLKNDAHSTGLKDEQARAVRGELPQV